VVAEATNRTGRFWDQPFGIWNKEKNYSLEVDPKGEWHGG